MTILVTGGAGYIGSHVVLACLDAGREAVVIDDLSTGCAEAVPAGVPLHVADCANPAALARVWREHRIEAVVHMAARISVPDSLRDPLGYYAANTCASATLLSHCARRGVGAFVFSSTAAVYGACGAGPVSETAPLRPMTPYGRSKLMTEQMIADAGLAHGLPHAVLRYFNVAGADPMLRAGQRAAGAAHLLGRICDVATGARPRLEIYGSDYDTPDGTCIRDFVHVSDLARAHVRALDHLLDGGESLTLNVGTGRGVSVAEAAAAGARVSRRPIPVELRPRRAGDMAEVVADPAALMERLRWRPEHADIDTMLSTALRFEAERAGRRAA